MNYKQTVPSPSVMLRLGQCQAQALSWALGLPWHALSKLPSHCLAVQHVYPCSMYLHLVRLSADKLYRMLAGAHLPAAVLQIELDEDGREVELGKGAFGVVVRGRYRLSPVAIKRLINQKPEQQAQFLQEMAILRACRGSRYIVPFVGASLLPVSARWGSAPCRYCLHVPAASLGAPAALLNPAVFCAAGKLTATLYGLRSFASWLVFQSIDCDSFARAHIFQVLRMAGVSDTLCTAAHQANETLQSTSILATNHVGAEDDG